MSSTLLDRRRRRDTALAAVPWVVLLIALIPLVAAVTFVRRGGGLEGWTGSPAEQLFGWTLLAAPYVVAAWAPVMVFTLVIAYVLDLSRCASLALAIGFSIGLLGLLGYML